MNRLQTEQHAAEREMFATATDGKRRLRGRLLAIVVVALCTPPNTFPDLRNSLPARRLYLACLSSCVTERNVNQQQCNTFAK